MAELRRIGKTVLHRDIVAKMEAKGFSSVQEMSLALGISRQTLIQYLHGTREMPFHTARKLAHGLGMSLERLGEIYEEIYPLPGTCASNDAQGKLVPAIKEICNSLPAKCYLIAG